MMVLQKAPIEHQETTYQNPQQYVYFYAPTICDGVGAYSFCPVCLFVCMSVCGTKP